VFQARSESVSHRVVGRVNQKSALVSRACYRGAHIGDANWICISIKVLNSLVACW
jgi:hypothetical protein